MPAKRTLLTYCGDLLAGFEKERRILSYTRTTESMLLRKCGDAALNAAPTCEKLLPSIEACQAKADDLNTM